MCVIIFFLLVIFTSGIQASESHFSTAGFYELANSGREVYNMNVGWRFYKGSCPDAWQREFDDSSWEVVSIPHGLELLPEEASGNINYQGRAWYRKNFSVPANLKDKKVYLHFEGIMGKSRIWLNGKLLKEHFNGYLPIIADVTEDLNFEMENTLSICADNSDDPSFLPGKPQQALDFTYFGGIYRDCFLIAHNQVHITDANYEDEIAGGGVFIHYPFVSEDKAEIGVKIHLRNESSGLFKGKLMLTLRDISGKEISRGVRNLSLRKDKANYYDVNLYVECPKLWTPDSPILHQLEIKLVDGNGILIDGMLQKVGIRKIEYRGRDGLYLNNKPYRDKLIGVNRHQEFAIIGNALPNSLHWRDAKKLRDAGVRIIRCTQYPHDPAFLDACDEFGILTVLAVAGWQFWNDEPIFAQRVYSDIRNMVRRDRNHPCVWMWEPILNETWYPAEFAKNVVDVLNEEYPYPYCYAGCDVTARGHEHFPIHFTHPVMGGGGAFNTETLNPDVCYFTREWGDNVDDWYSHNSPSRVNRVWGEVPMLIQAQGYANPDYKYTCYDVLYRTSRQHMGGCLWHSFDHQRGYHPDPFYGGIMDAFRQPKFSYYMFCSQRPAEENKELIADSGPMVYIANEMTPFSPKDVTVYSNCEEVRLTFCKNGKQHIYHKPIDKAGMPSPVITFSDVFDFMYDKQLSRGRKQTDSYLLAEGLIAGKVVATHKVMPTRRPSKILLWADDEKVSMKANGSDIMTVIAAIADDNGNIKRLNNYEITFEIEGPGQLIADSKTFTNPAPVRWGTAPVLVRSSTVPGEIKVRASVVWQGKHTPVSAELIIPTYQAEHILLADKKELERLNSVSGQKAMSTDFKGQNGNNLKRQQKVSRSKLKEVEKQQSDFE